MTLNRERRERRLIGAFYTPEFVARQLVRWANPDSLGRILDPSFGGCSFLTAAVDEARSFDRNLSGVIGVDIDDTAFDHARSLVSSGLPARNVVRSDFFELEPDDLGGNFAAIVGNPPYVRHHLLTDTQKRSAISATRKKGIELPNTSDAWAYFVAHSTSFLTCGGRMAFVLPEAVIYAHYASGVLELLKKSFESVRFVRIAQRLFSGTDYQCVVVACAGYGHGPAKLILSDVESGSDLAAALSTPPRTARSLEPRDLDLAKLTSKQRRAWKRYARDDNALPLGSVAKVRIGVVTGANAVFVHSASEASALVGPTCTALPVVSRASDLRLAQLTCKDFGIDDPIGQRLLCIRGGFDTLNEALRRHIRNAESRGIHLRSHTSKRQRWYELPEVGAPDGFMPYMGASPAPLVVNLAGATSTNGVHRLWWRSMDRSLADAVVGSWTSAFRVSAEISGRHYGGGVLKLEPGEAKRMQVPIVSGAGALLPELDRLIRSGDEKGANTLADSAVLEKGMGLDVQDVQSLRSAALALASARKVSSRWISR